MVLDHEREYSSQWSTIRSIAEMIGCTSETLRKWIRQAERDQDLRAGFTTLENNRIKELERENKELRHANENLRELTEGIELSLDNERSCSLLYLSDPSPYFRSGSGVCFGKRNVGI
jgi:transposase